MIHHGDTLDLMTTLPGIEDVRVVLTDPPYVANKYIRELEAEHYLHVPDDMEWCGNSFHWVGMWLRPLRMRLAPEAVGWIFCNVHYMGFYLRWAHLMNWPLRGIFAMGTGEFLLAFGWPPLVASDAEAVHLAVKTHNTYGHHKHVGMLRTIVRCSLPGLVFDPFCGEGSSLVAATLEGRDTLGIDSDLATITVAEKAIRHVQT